jgi:hypothetical protein
VHNASDNKTPPKNNKKEKNKQTETKQNKTKQTAKKKKKTEKNKLTHPQCDAASSHSFHSPAFTLTIAQNRETYQAALYRLELRAAKTSRVHVAIKHHATQPQSTPQCTYTQHIVQQRTWRPHHLHHATHGHLPSTSLTF